MMSHARLDERPSYLYQDSTSGSDSDSQCHDQDSKLTFRSSLPVPSPTLRQYRENRFASPSFYGHNYENDPRVFSSTKAFSASNRTEDYANYVPCFRYDVESRDWAHIKYYRKSTTVKQGYSRGNEARSRPIQLRNASTDVEKRFNSNTEYTSLNTSQRSMPLTTKMYELSYPLSAQGVKVVYTTDALEAEKWLRYNVIDCPTQVSAVGFDIEWKPQFVSKKYGGTENETAVLQLAVDNSCLVLHAYHMDRLPKSLKLVLRDKDILKVGSDIKRDGSKLKRDLGLVLEGLADIQLMAKEIDPSMRKTGLKALAQTFLGIELDKTKAMSNWEKYPLTFTQIEYAALDAWIGLKIFQKMKRHPLWQENALSEGECIKPEHYEEIKLINEEGRKSRFWLFMMFIFFSYILFCVIVRPRT